MGFMDKLKGKQRRHSEPEAPLPDDESYAGPYTVGSDEQDDLRDTVQDASLNTTISVAEGSIISEAAPSSLQRPYPDRSAPSATTSRRALLGARVRLPLIGRWSSDRQQRLLGGMLALGGLGLVLASVMAVRTAGGSSAQIGATGQALMQSQRLAKAVLQALAGQPQAFAEVRAALTPYVARKPRDHHYWQGPPCSMLIDEVETIWAAIDQKDDWQPFHAKIARIREMGEAMT